MLPVEKLAEPVEGNREVVELLEGWLARAKLGYLNGIAVIAAESPTVAFSDHAGVNTTHFAMYVVVDQLKCRLVENILPGAPHVRAPPEPDIPANYVAYDCENEPLQYDFLPWLVNCEMTRVREGVQEPLEVGFYNGPTNVVSTPRMLSNRALFYDNVVLPLVRMIGGTVSDKAVGGRRRPSCYSFVEAADAVRAGEAIPRLRLRFEIQQAVRRDFPRGKPITITLREANHWPERNSNLDSWLRFAMYLEEGDENVVFIRDTAKAQESLCDFNTSPLASVDLDYRVALYEHARCNFFVANGPWTLALLGHAPWLAFINADPMSGYIPNTPQWWRKNHGIAVGGQFPWSSARQRIIWKPDTYEDIVRAWEELQEQL